MIVLIKICVGRSFSRKAPSHAPLLKSIRTKRRMKNRGERFSFLFGVSKKITNGIASAIPFSDWLFFRGVLSVCTLWRLCACALWSLRICALRYRKTRALCCRTTCTLRSLHARALLYLCTCALCRLGSCTLCALGNRILFVELFLFAFLEERADATKHLSTYSLPTASLANNAVQN